MQINQWYRSVLLFVAGVSLAVGYSVLQPSIAGAQMDVNQQGAQVTQVVVDALSQDSGNVAGEPAPQVRNVKFSPSGQWSVANWLWGEAGGQALLQLQNGQWQIVAKGGGAFSAEQLMQDYAVPQDDAYSLAPSQSSMNP